MKHKLIREEAIINIPYLRAQFETDNKFIVFEDIGAYGYPEYEFKGVGILRKKDDYISLFDKYGDERALMNTDEIQSGYWIVNEI